MKKWWIWWANTNKNWLKFEKDVEFIDLLATLKWYEIKKIENLKESYKIFFFWKNVAETYKKHDLYKWFLDKKWINRKELISAKLLPDNAIYVFINNTLFIVEIKYQEVSWSTDEKLQTCDFKKKQYERLLWWTNIKLEFCYVLNNWFKQEKYNDVLNYIQAMNCKYFFETLPLDYLWLPKVTNA